MGILTAVGAIASAIPWKKVGSALGGVLSRSKKPVARAVASGATQIGLGYAGAKLAGGSSNLPVPVMSSGSRSLAPVYQKPSGLLPLGPGGKVQLPWNDLNEGKLNQQFNRPAVLDDQFLRVYYRAPKGYVIVKLPINGQVRPVAMLKSVARANGLWHPARKPPITAGDWHQFQTAKRVEKKLKKIAGPALRKYGHHHEHTTTKKGR